MEAEICEGYEGGARASGADSDVGWNSGPGSLLESLLCISRFCYSLMKYSCSLSHRTWDSSGAGVHAAMGELPEVYFGSGEFVTYVGCEPVRLMYAYTI